MASFTANGLPHWDPPGGLRTRRRLTLQTIVNRGEWLWNPTKFFAVLFTGFWSWPCRKHNFCLLLTEELTNRNVTFRSLNSCIVYERKTKYCARSLTVLKITYRFVYLALEKDKLKNLPKTVVCSLNNEGRVIFKLKLIYLNESKQK